MSAGHLTAKHLRTQLKALRSHKPGEYPAEPARRQHDASSGPRSKPRGVTLISVPSAKLQVPGPGAAGPHLLAALLEQRLGLDPTWASLPAWAVLRHNGRPGRGRGQETPKTLCRARRPSLGAMAPSVSAASRERPLKTRRRR